MPSGQSDLSPCVRQCCLDAQDVCLGCHRTLDDILNWHRLSDTEKKQRMHALTLIHGPSANSFITTQKNGQ
ncbi:DUF1289 domain-containing protein [Shewanella sp.]